MFYKKNQMFMEFFFSPIKLFEFTMEQKKLVFFKASGKKISVL